MLVTRTSISSPKINFSIARSLYLNYLISRFHKGRNFIYIYDFNSFDYNYFEKVLDWLEIKEYTFISQVSQAQKYYDFALNLIKHKYAYEDDDGSIKLFIDMEIVGNSWYDYVAHKRFKITTKHINFTNNITLITPQGIPSKTFANIYDDFAHKISNIASDEYQSKQSIHELVTRFSIKFPIPKYGHSGKFYWKKEILDQHDITLNINKIMSETKHLNRAFLNFFIESTWDPKIIINDEKPVYPTNYLIDNLDVGVFKFKHQEYSNLYINKIQNKYVPTLGTIA